MTAHRNHWRTTILLFALTGLVESLAFGHLSAFTPLFLKELQVPPDSIPSWTGILSALGFIIGLPLLPFWGVWSDRYGRKLIIIRSSVFGALMFGLAAVSPNVWMLAFARFLSGLVLGNTGVMMAVQAEITPREKLGLAVAVISAGSPIGMAAGPYLGGLLVQMSGIRTLLLIDALLTALVAVALALFLREEARPPVREQSALAGVRESLRAIVGTPAVRSLFGVVFLLAFGISMTMPYTPILVETLYAGPAPRLAPTIGKVLTAAGITMAISTPFWGRIGDRFGHLPTLRLCALAVAITMFGLALSAEVWQVGAWRAAQGMCVGGIGALAMVLLALYAPRDRRSTILTLSLLPQQISWFLGPVSGSALTLWSLRAPFWAGGVALLLGLLASLRLPPPAPQEETGGAAAGVRSVEESVTGDRRTRS